jgi:hypothetical protein
MRIHAETRTRQRAAGLASALAAGLAVTACGSSGGGAPLAPSTLPAVSSNAPAPGTGPVSSSAVVPTPGDQPDKAPAGSDVGECSDGNCELDVSGRVEIRLTGQGGGITTLSVEDVDPAGLSYRTVAAGGTSAGNIELGCTLSLFRGGQRSICTSGSTPEPPPRKAGVLAMQLVSVHSGIVRLRLVSG